MTDLDRKICQWIKKNNAVTYAYRPLKDYIQHTKNSNQSIGALSGYAFLKLHGKRYNGNQINAIIKFIKDETGEEMKYNIERGEVVETDDLAVQKKEIDNKKDQLSSFGAAQLEKPQNPFARAAFIFIEGIRNKNTRKAYQHTLVDFFRLFKNPSLVETEHIILYTKYCEERGNSVATIERKLAALNSFFDFLVKQNLIAKNPVDVKRARIDPYSRAKKITKEMYEKICTVIDRNSVVGSRDYAILQFCFYTGRRIGEILSLRKNDLFHRDGRYFYRYNIEKKRSPKQKIRVIPQKVLDAIESYWICAKYYPVNDEPIFISHSPQNQGAQLSYDAFYRLFRKYCEAAGLDEEIDLHSLRHLRTELLEEKGVSIRKLSDELDHEQLHQTLIYTKALSDREADDDQYYSLLDE